MCHFAFRSQFALLICLIQTEQSLRSTVLDRKRLLQGSGPSHLLAFARWHIVLFYLILSKASIVIRLVVKEMLSWCSCKWKYHEYFNSVPRLYIHWALEGWGEGYGIRHPESRYTFRWRILSVTLRFLRVTFAFKIPCAIKTKSQFTCNLQHKSMYVVLKLYTSWIGFLGFFFMSKMC
jgi:hypothetical protein